MNELERVPSQIILSGEGLERMSPIEYQNFVSTLGRIGIDVQHVESPAELHDDESGIYETQAETSAEMEPRGTTYEDIRSFAAERGYSESLAARVWKGLQHAYVLKRDQHNTEIELRRDFLEVEFECPVVFDEVAAFAQRGQGTPAGRLETVQMDSLKATVAWLFEEGGYARGWFPIRGYGHRSFSFLAHYVNEAAKPDVPFRVKFNPEEEKPVADTVPEPDMFTADVNSPYLEHIKIGETVVPVATAKSVREFGLSIGIEHSQMSRIGTLFDGLGEMLAESFPGIKNQQENASLENGLVRFSRPIAMASPKFRPIEVEWGLEPHALVKILHDRQEGRVLVYGLSDFAAYLFSKYITEIQLQPDSPDTGGAAQVV